MIHFSYIGEKESKGITFKGPSINQCPMCPRWQSPEEWGWLSLCPWHPPAAQGMASRVWKMLRCKQQTSLYDVPSCSQLPYMTLLLFGAGSKFPSVSKQKTRLKETVTAESYLIMSPTVYTTTLHKSIVIAWLYIQPCVDRTMFTQGILLWDGNVLHSSTIVYWCPGKISSRMPLNSQIHRWSNSLLRNICIFTNKYLHI